MIKLTWVHNDIKDIIYLNVNVIVFITKNHRRNGTKITTIDNDYLNVSESLDEVLKRIKNGGR